MTRRKANFGNCVRCFGNATPATNLTRFGYKGVPYQVALCQSHQVMLDRDMTAWIRTAHELGMPPATPDPRPDDPGRRMKVTPPPAPRLVPEGNEADWDGPLSFLQPEEIAPGTLEVWGDAFTEHARHRMAERGITRQQVWRTIQASGKTVRRPAKPDAPDTAIYEYLDVKVVVDERTRSVLTVARPSDEVFDSEAV